MDYEETYQQVMALLQTKARPHLKLSADDFQNLAEILGTLLEKAGQNELQFTEIHKILCILGNTQNFSPLFTPYFATLLNNPRTPAEILTFTLAATQKHTIQICQRNGDKVPSSVLLALKALLKHPSPEILEWTLRTLSQMGGQIISIKSEILKCKPGIFSFLNPHLIEAKKIIEEMEKRWSPPKK